MTRSVEERVMSAHTTPLQHVYPQWEEPEDDPGGELREVWRGQMRIVHSQRARKLRKRGVPMWTLHKPGDRAKYAWFVEAQ